MESTMINLSKATVQDLQSFAGVLAKYTVDLDLKSGRYTVDARSIMGILALNLREPIEFIINSDDSAVVNAVLADVKTWIA